MKKKKNILISAAVAAVLCICLIVSNSLSPKIVAVDASTVKTEVSSDDSDWSTVDTGMITIENNNYILIMDCETTHFSVQSRSSGDIYHSVAQAEVGYEPMAEQLAEVQITYYDSKSTQAKMNSYENSVEHESYSIKTDGSSIRVYYSIQKSEKKIFVPIVIGKEVFEEQLLPKLESGPARRLKSFYTLYESDATDSDTKKMKSTYLALAKEDLYILNDTAGEHNYSEITGYMETAEYNQSDYANEAERLGLDAEAAENMPAAFVIPVEYTLTDDGFTATVLTDKIDSASDNYHLTKVSLLPYFASGRNVENGWFMVPDGSGAIIELAEKAGMTYSQNVWGNDMAVELSASSVLMQNAGLPVFGYHNGEGAVFAEITGAAAVATVNAEVFGKEVTQNHIYTDFNVLSFDSSNMGGQQRQAKFNLYSQDYVAEFPQVRYTLYDESETTYSDMAATCREHLISQGVLDERLEADESVPLYLDFTGYETAYESFLGISLKADVVLSTLEDIESSLNELEDRDMKNVHLRLKAYSDDGLYGTAPNDFSIDNCIGSMEELENLSRRLNQNGGILYLDNNFSSVNKARDGYDTMTHAVRGLKKTVLQAFDYDLVSRKVEDAVNYYYMTSPAYYESLTMNFVEGMKESYGYSWSDFGSKLWSDFNKKHPYDRAQTADTMSNVMAQAKEKVSGVMTDGSNSYALSTTDTFLNMPLSNSGLNCESYAIPFYQMVIRGYVNYAGAPMNVGADLEKNYLASIESGADLYYSFYTADDEVMKKTASGILVYPTRIGASYDTVESQYETFKELFNDLQGCIITEHERVAEDVFVTTYDNGTAIAVNYSAYNTEINGTWVPARGYAVVERGSNE